jgi:hypothetical protein
MVLSPLDIRRQCWVRVEADGTITEVSYNNGGSRPSGD